MKKSYKLKKGIKTALIVCALYALLVAFLCWYSDRIAGLDENSYTEDGHSKTMELFKKEK